MPSRERRLELVKRYLSGPKGILRFGKEVLGFSEIEIGGPHLEIAEVLWKTWRGELKDPVIMAHRGIFKTTLCSIVFPTWLLANNRKLNIFIVSSTSKVAIDCVMSVREALENKKLVKIYGPFRQAGLTWKKDEIVVRGHSLKSKEPSLRAGGVDTQLTGGHYDFIICDDLESRENTLEASDEVRESVKKYYNSLIPILKESEEEPGRRLLIGTLWHYDGLLANLERQGRVTLKIPALRNGEVVFSPVFTHEKLERIKNDDPLLFETQYMLNAEVTKPTTFEASHIQYVRPEDVDKKNTIVHLKVDLGGNTRTADPYAVVVLGAQRLPGNQKRWVVLDYMTYNLDVRMFAKVLLALYRKMKSEYVDCRLVVEMVGWQLRFKEIWNFVCEEENEYIPIHRIDDRLSKDKRFSLIQPYIITGRLVFVRNANTKRLIDEMVNFGMKNVRDDGVDALSFGFEETVFPSFVPSKPEEVPLEDFIEGYVKSTKKDPLIELLA